MIKICDYYSDDEFKQYMIESRDKFGIAINKQNWNRELRAEAESLLICFDQMRDEIAKKEARVRELEAMILELNEMCDYSSKYSELDIIFKISDMANGLNPPESGEK